MTSPRTRLRSASLLSVLLALCVLMPATDASAQIRGFADIGGTKFTASETFKAILGSDAGVVYGGGVEVDLPHQLFLALRASRFEQDGHRVFVHQGQTFVLDVDTTVTVTPIELSGGYRFNPTSRIVPYVGGGVSWYRYRETSQFATTDENVSEQFTGYHILGGAAFRLARLLHIAGEASWSTVPDALGQSPDSVASTFDETDLGGLTFRAKVVIGR